MLLLFLLLQRRKRRKRRRERRKDRMRKMRRKDREGKKKWLPTNRLMDRLTNGQTKPLIEMHRRI